MPLFAVMTVFFAGAALVLFVIGYLLLPRKSTLERRLDAMKPAEEAGVSPLMRPAPKGWQSFFEKLGKKVPLRPSEYGKYRRAMLAAGLRKEVLPIFIGSKIFLAVLIPGLYLLFYGLPLQKDPRVMILSSMALLVVGFLAPSWWLSKKTKKRQLKIFHDLPDVLDLMTVCVEAGLSMESAMLRISQDWQFAKSPIAQEMKTALQETRAGKPRHDALKDMAERSGERDLKAFAAMLIQTERLGTSLAESLRVHSDFLRTRRRQIAEEEAAKTSVKLLFPLVFMLMPSMFVVMAVPALIRISRVFSEM